MSLRRALELFDEVIDLPLDAQEATLRARCDDEAICAQVLKLLDADRREQADSDGLDQLLAPDTLSPGTVIGRVVIEHCLGEGGQASVWAVRHRLLGRRMALKVLRQSEDASRLLREGRAQAALRHDNLLPVHDVLDVFGRPGLLMPLVEGPSLAALLEQAPPTPAEARDLLLGITAGLRHAHAAGFVHRDLKPANVLLDLRGDRVVPRVADFGLVKARDALRTQVGMVMGTPAYAAPEQLRDAAGAGPPADIFSLGALLVELLTGHLPFPGDSLPAIRQSHTLPPRLDGLPAPLRETVTAMLAMDPAARPDAADVHRVLSRWTPPPARSDLPARLRSMQQPATAAPVTESWSDTPHNLPAPRGRLFGRTAELSTLAAALRDGRLVTLTGPSGIGRRTLARSLGRQTLPQWSGGVWLAAIPDDAPAGRRLLICEDPPEAGALAARLAANPALTILAVAEAPLGLDDEQTHRVGPLDAESAAALFAARATAVDHRLDVAAFCEDIAALVEHLGRHPGRIERAAARCRMLSPRAILRRLRKAR